MTRERLLEIFDVINRKTGDDEEIMTLLKEVSDNYDSGYSREDVEDEKGRKWRDSYEDLRRRYVERFYAPEGSQLPEDDVFVEEAEAEDKDVKNYEALFK